MNSDDELPSQHSSIASSPPPFIASSLERLHILSSSDSDTQDEPIDYDAVLNQQDPYEDIPLTPIIENICPLSPRLINYYNIPSISSIPSLPSIEETATTSSVRVTRKTKARKQIAPVAKRSKNIKKKTLAYKWKKAVFRHSVQFESCNIDSVPPNEDPKNLSCLDYFFKFFSNDVMTLVTEQTNLYSTQATGKSISLSENELQDFLAIHILMGIVKMPSYLDYWSHKFRYSQVADIMTLKRYQKIRRYLHFNDNNFEDSDRFYKVRTIVEQIRQNCLQGEKGNRFSVDEMMIPYKGRKAGNRKQYMKDKPTKWGFKNYVRAGVDGMIFDFLLYGGEDTFRFHTFTDEEVSLGFGARIVIALCQSIKNKPAIVFCDNFFSSPELFYILKKNYGIFGLGTIRNNRIRGAEKFLPDEKSMRKKPRGSYAQVVCDKTKLAVVRWNDNKPVTLISSFVGAEPLHQIKRYSKELKKKVNVDCPQIVKEYNKHMGGVDLADMLVSLYRIPFKTRRWYIGIFSQLIDICLNNAWILYKKECKSDKKMSLKAFRYEVYQNLVKKDRSQDLKKDQESCVRNPRSARPPSPIRYDNVGHFVSTKEDMGRCKFCHKNTTVYCIKCNIRLCFVTGKNGRNCFLNFHAK